MLLRVIESIRKKPKAVRKHYAFVVTILFTAMVAGVWMMSLPSRFVAIQEGVFEAPAVETQAASVPFSTIWSQLKKEVIGTVGVASQPGDDLVVPTSTATDDQAREESRSVQLESGSTITFGATDSTPTPPTILLGISSTSPSTSPQRE